MIQLFDNIQAPAQKRGAPGNKYPFADMQVGQSFFVEIGEAEPEKVADRMKGSGARWRKLTGATDTKFTVAVTTHPEDVTKEVVGVWRTA